MSNTIHNNNDNYNNINTNNNTRTNGTQACAACKYQRRKCASDCLLAPYFPHHFHHQFLNAHKLFGVSNITKIIRHLSQPQKDQAMRAIKYESDVRAIDPVGGSCHIIRTLQRQIKFACAELELVLQQLAVCRAAATADTVSLLCDLDPQTQTHSVEFESENVIAHCDSMINNGLDDHDSNAYKTANEALSPIYGQCQQQSQPENVTIECDSMIKNSPEDHLYQHDHYNENNEKEDIGIEEYFLEGGNVTNDDNNDNVIFPSQDIDVSWDVQDILVCCLHDKEGCDLRPSVMDIGGENDEVISKDNKATVHEETASRIFNDEKPTLREDFDTIEDVESRGLRTAAT